MPEGHLKTSGGNRRRRRKPYARTSQTSGHDRRIMAVKRSRIPAVDRQWRKSDALPAKTIGCTGETGKGYQSRMVMRLQPMPKPSLGRRKQLLQ